MELDIEMASLELGERKRRFSAATSENEKNEQSADETENKILRRSTRKRIRPLDIDKRRVYTKPKKFNGGKDSEVTGYYLDKKVKLVHTSLETIFEEPKNSEAVMSGRKLKRIINFPVGGTEKLKTKKRSMKAKKVFSKKFRKFKKVTKELFLQKMEEIDDIEEV